MSCSLKFNKAWLVVAKGPEWTFPVRVFYEPNPVNRLKARSAARKLRNELNAGESFDKVPKPVREPHLLRMSRFHVVQIPLEYLGDQVGDELFEIKTAEDARAQVINLELEPVYKEIKAAILERKYIVQVEQVLSPEAIRKLQDDKFTIRNKFEGKKFVGISISWGGA